jgi:hypothetical protein
MKSFPYALFLLVSCLVTAQEAPDQISRPEWSKKVQSLIEGQTDTLNAEASPIPALPDERTTLIEQNHPLVQPVPESPPDPTVQNVRQELKLFGDHTIPVGEVSYDRIRIVGGNLTVDGTVMGQISVIGGDVFLHKTAVVEGEIIAIGGNIHRDPGAVITGKVIETNLKEGLVYREYEKEPKVKGQTQIELEQRSLRARISWIHPEMEVFIYNRNEGLLLTPFNFRWDRESLSSFRLSLSLGYRFAQKVPAGRVTLEKSFFLNRNLILYGSIFREARTDDYYRLPEGENSLAAVLGRQDFYDRWDEQGFETGLGIDLSLIKLKLSLASVHEDSIPVTDLWSLFEKNRPLRPNLVIPSRQIYYFESTLAFRTRRYDPFHSGLALFLHLIGYQAAGEASGLLSLDPFQTRNRIFAMAILNWEFSEGLVLRTRLIGGTSQRELDPYRYFGVGGLGSVSAHAYKVQTGDQMLQSNIELIFTPEFLGGDLLLKLFADVGHAWMKKDYSFTEVWDQQDNFIMAGGIGIGQADDEDWDWGVNIAQSLDGRRELETTFRLHLNF